MEQGNMEIRISKRKLKSIAKFFTAFTLFMLLAIALSSAQRLPNIGTDQNNWGTVLNQFLNVSHTENGTFKKGFNASINNLNVTDKFNASLGNSSFPETTISCGAGNVLNIIDLHRNGTLTATCVADANSGTQPTTSQIFKNITLSVSEIGIINETNTTWVQGQKVLNATWADNSSGVEWNKISKIPSGFADGVDDTGAGSGITNGSDGNITKLNVYSLNGTALSLFNKSIDLSGYILLLGAPFSDMQTINVTNILGGTNDTIISGKNNQSWINSIIYGANTSWITINEQNPTNATISAGNIGGASALYTNDNISRFLGDPNSTIIRTINLSTLNTLGNYIKTADFSLSQNNTWYTNYSIANWTFHYSLKTDVWGIANMTLYLGGSGRNASLIDTGNITAGTMKVDLGNVTIKGNLSANYATISRVNITGAGMPNNNATLQIGNFTGWSNGSHLIWQ